MGDMVAAAGDEIDRAASLLRERHPEERAAIESAARALADDLEHARAADPELYGPELHLVKQEGFVRVAFRLAFWELVHAYTFEEALLDVINRGGDADTNGAITGALVGALFGEQGIVGQWYEAVLSALQDQPAEPLATTYHPRRFMEIAASMTGPPRKIVLGRPDAEPDPTPAGRKIKRTTDDSD
jgi:ADP-ribosylglycohydrolase